MPLITNRQEMPDAARLVLDLVEKFGFKAGLDYEFPTPNFTERVQIRSTEHTAPKQTVAAIALAFQRGEKSPPIIVTKDGKLVDGNTRAAAARKNKQPYIAALVLNHAYAGASEEVLRRFTLLGAAANTRHGHGIDRDEIRQVVEEVLKDKDFTFERTAVLLGIKATTVASIAAENAARSRAESLGVHVNGSIPAHSVQVLGKNSSKLNDVPFKELVALAQDAGLNTSDFDEVLKAMTAATTDEAKLDVVSTWREARKLQIEAFKVTGKARPVASQKLRQAMGSILKYEDNPQAAIEHNPTLVSDYFDVLKRTRLTIIALETAQTQALPRLVGA